MHLERVLTYNLKLAERNPDKQFLHNILFVATLKDTRIATRTPGKIPGKTPGKTPG